MENLVRNIPGVVVYLDDILITSKTPEQHLKSLEEVLHRMEEAGLQLRKNKCSFISTSVA